MGQKTTTNRILSLLTRRRFVKSAAAAMASAGIVGTVARAAEPPRVSEGGAMAKALSYVHDAQTIDAAKRFSNQYCHNCALFRGDTTDEWAACSIFPGKLVAGGGWCSAWVANETH